MITTVTTDWVSLSHHSEAHESSAEPLFSRAQFVSQMVPTESAVTIHYRTRLQLASCKMIIEQMQGCHKIIRSKKGL